MRSFRVKGELLTLLIWVFLLAGISFISFSYAAGDGGNAAHRLTYWTATSLEKVFIDSPPKMRRRLQLEGAKGEYEAGQIVLRAPVEFVIEGIDFSPLRNVRTGEMLQNYLLRARFVGYVPLLQNTPNTPPEELLRQAPDLFPDPLFDPDYPIKVSAQWNQPIWITLRIPEDAPAGRYKGEVRIRTSLDNVSVPLYLKIYNFSIGRQSHLWITNWMSTPNIAKYHGIKAYSEEFWRILRRYAEDMAEHRQNCIITPLKDLIQVTEDEQGTLHFDFSRFDRWVELFMEAGVIGRIEGSHLGRRTGGWESTTISITPWRIYREDGSSYTTSWVVAGTDESHQFLSKLLPALQEHLEERGWLDIYIQHIADEPTDINADSYKVFASLIKEYAPRIKLMDAVLTAKIEGALDIYVPILHNFYEQLDFWRGMQKKGYEVWFYTCCAPTGKYLNRFIDYSLAKVRLLHWANYLYGSPGYLHWGYNRRPS